MKEQWPAVKDLARLLATLWDEAKAWDWVAITDRNNVYDVVLLLKKCGLPVTSAALDDLMEKVEENKRTD